MNINNIKTLNIGMMSANRGEKRIVEGTQSEFPFSNSGDPPESRHSYGFGKKKPIYNLIYSTSNNGTSSPPQPISNQTLKSFSSFKTYIHYKIKVYK